MSQSVYFEREGRGMSLVDLCKAVGYGVSGAQGGGFQIRIPLADFEARSQKSMQEQVLDQMSPYELAIGALSGRKNLVLQDNRLKEVIGEEIVKVFKDTGVANISKVKVEIDVKGGVSVSGLFKMDGQDNFALDQLLVAFSVPFSFTVSAPNSFQLSFSLGDYAQAKMKDAGISSDLTKGLFDPVKEPGMVAFQAELAQVFRKGGWLADKK